MGNVTIDSRRLIKLERKRVNTRSWQPWFCVTDSIQDFAAAFSSVPPTHKASDTHQQTPTHQNTQEDAALGLPALPRMNKEKAPFKSGERVAIAAHERCLMTSTRKQTALINSRRHEMRRKCDPINILSVAKRPLLMTSFIAG